MRDVSTRKTLRSASEDVSDKSIDEGGGGGYDTAQMCRSGGLGVLMFTQLMKGYLTSSIVSQSPLRPALAQPRHQQTIPSTRKQTGSTATILPTPKHQATQTSSQGTKEKAT